MYIKMDPANDNSLSPLFALLKYKKLAEDPANHRGMVSDKTTINFLAYVLDSKDQEVLETSLDTLQLLCESECSREAIKSTFGVTEALTALLNNTKFNNSPLQEKAEKIIKKLQTSDSPLKNSVKTFQHKNKKVLTLHIHGLHLETQKELEHILTKKTKGVHSVMVDVEHQKCTVTVYEHVDPKNVALVISENTDMEAKLVTRNKYNQEILIPLTERDKPLNFEDLPSYLDEQDSPVKDKAVRSTKDIRIAASEWFCSAAGFLQRTFYWVHDRGNSTNYKYFIKPMQNDFYGGKEFRVLVPKIFDELPKDLLKLEKIGSVNLLTGPPLMLTSGTKIKFELN